MDPERWSRVRAIAEEALALEPAARDAYLAGAAADDPSLLDDVRPLLAADEAGPDLGWIVDRAAEDAAAAAPVGDLIGRRIGRYRIVARVGAGGMGTVYEAEQDEPRRRVAVKTLKLGVDSDEARQRFRLESQVLARLSHPGIATVHEAGTEGDVPFLAMEFVERARTLTAYADDEALDVGARLRLFLDVCDAVEYGHRRGVVHRDLKPQNLLVDRDGRVKIIDFGVARALEPSPDVTVFPTAAGEIVGTLSYMSPEQLAGDPQAIDVRVDVYALGVVLFELLSGSRPKEVEGLGLTEAIRVLAETDPRPLLRLRGDLDPELGWIAARALESDRDRRYRGAAELADDVRRHLAHEPVEAGPPTAGYRLRKLVRRHRAAFAAGAALLLLLLAGLVTVSLGLVRERELRRRAEAGVDFFLDTFSSMGDHERGSGLLVADLLDDAATRLDRLAGDDDEFAIDLHLSIAGGYFAVEEHEKALAHLERILPLVEDRPDLHCAGLQDVARSLGLLGRTGESIEAYRRASDAARDRLGPGDDRTLRIEAAFAGALSKVGRYDEALARLDAAEARTDDDTDEGLRFSLLVQRLRVATHAQRPTAAAAAFTALVEHVADALGRAPFGESDAERFEDLARMIAEDPAGSTDLAFRIVDDAEPLHGYALDLALDGDDDAGFAIAGGIDVLATTFLPERESRRIDLKASWALLLLEAERYDRGDPLLREVIDALVERFGENHPPLAQHRMNLAWSLYLRDRRDEAAEEARRALAIAEATVEEGTIELATRRATYADVVAEAGALEEALVAGRKAVETFRRLLPPGDRRRRDAVEGVAMTLEALGRSAEAEEERRRELAEEE